MQIVKNIEELRSITKWWRGEGHSIGLVPTMGYLHDGHKSLIEKAVSENDRVVVSDFVNPTQFGVNEDLSSYPRDIDRDAAICEAVGADVVFHPDPEEMYFLNHCTFVDMDRLTKGLCGKTRPTHFRGVCTVVSKLFNIVTPDRAYFGQKDAQQLAVIRRMVRDMNFGITIVGCPIVREADGLAMSSRNTYLNPKEREAALLLFWLFCGGMAVLTLTPGWFNWLPLLKGLVPDHVPFFTLGSWNLVPGRCFEGGLWQSYMLLGNIIMFVPFGFFSALLWRGYTWKRALLTGFCITAFVECWQLCVGRAFDIDDIILNTLGVFCGYLLR